jgi:hypothetical protein
MKNEIKFGSGLNFSKNETPPKSRQSPNRLKYTREISPVRQQLLNRTSSPKSRQSSNRQKYTREISPVKQQLLERTTLPKSRESPNRLKYTREISPVKQQLLEEKKLFNRKTSPKLRIKERDINRAYHLYAKTPTGISPDISEYLSNGSFINVETLPNYDTGKQLKEQILANKKRNKKRRKKLDKREERIKEYRKLPISERRKYFRVIKGKVFDYLRNKYETSIESSTEISG